MIRIKKEEKNGKKNNYIEDKLKNYIWDDIYFQIEKLKRKTKLVLTA